MRRYTLRLFDRLGIREGMSCLDLGCGGGEKRNSEKCIAHSGWMGTSLSLLEQIKRAYRRGNPLPSAATLGLL
jgi:cyclopropane fatty-acyl-phospholipid synthase-like methyltransferase